MKSMDRRLLDGIIRIGEAYCARYLTQYDKSVLLGDWWKALDFFLNRSCFQGRRDEVSQRVYEGACLVLSQHFTGSNRDAAFESQKRENWGGIKDQLDVSIGKGKVGKGGDVTMVISALSFISRIPDKNIVSYSVQKITDRQVREHYCELQRGRRHTGIFQVGPKIAALYLRDVVSVFGLHDYVDDEDVFCIEAVDTWVRKVANEFGINTPLDGKGSLEKAIVKMCQQNGVSAMRFSQGAWYLGAHAFELLIEELKRE